MSLLQWFRENRYRVQAAGYAMLGLFLAFVAIFVSPQRFPMRVLEVGVAVIAIIGGIRRTL
jgi:hypothetical protein